MPGVLSASFPLPFPRDLGILKAWGKEARTMGKKCVAWVLALVLALCGCSAGGGSSVPAGESSHPSAVEAVAQPTASPAPEPAPATVEGEVARASKSAFELRLEDGSVLTVVLTDETQVTGDPLLDGCRATVTYEEAGPGGGHRHRPGGGAGGSPSHPQPGGGKLRPGGAFSLYDPGGKGGPAVLRAGAGRRSRPGCGTVPLWAGTSSLGGTSRTRPGSRCGRTSKAIRTAPRSPCCWVWTRREARWCVLPPTQIFAMSPTGLPAGSMKRVAWTLFSLWRGTKSAPCKGWAST